MHMIPVNLPDLVYFEFTKSGEVPRIRIDEVGRQNYLSLGRSGKPGSKAAGKAKSARVWYRKHFIGCAA